MKAIILAATLTFVTFTASAQLNSRVGVDLNKSTKGVITAQKDNALKGGFDTRFHVTVTPKTNVPKKAAPEDYGTRAEVMTEDFAKMTTGEYEYPDLITEINLDESEYEYPWWNTNPDFTTLPHWGSTSAYPAGGTVCLFAEEDGYAHLNTPCLDVSANGGIAWIQFDARCATNESSDYVLLEAAETNNMGPSWNILGYTTLPTVTDQWQTFTAYFYGGGETTIFNLVNYYTNIYVDNIKVFTLNQYIAAPEMLPHTNYHGTEFDINCTAVDGATNYSWDVYELNNETGEKTYLHEGEITEEPTYHVSDAVSGQVYYCNAYAYKGERQSLPSAANYVLDLEAPVFNEVADFEGDSYTASWNSIPTAERYNYFAYGDRVIKEDGAFNVTEENFDGIKDSDGNLTGWTLENPSYQTYDTYYLSDFAQGGWKATHAAPYTDYLALDAWWYVQAEQGDAGLISPDLDLSKDNGKFSVSAKLFGEYNSYYESYTQCALALFNYNEEIGDYEQSELIYAADKNLKNEWTNCTANFTTGTKRSIIGIYAVWSPDNLYVDDLKITQNYQAGETFREPFLYAHWHEGENINVEIPKRFDACNIYHEVSAFKTDAYLGTVESKFSTLEEVGVAQGIKSVSLSKAAVQFSKAGIKVSNAKSETVEVYNLAGRLVYSDNTGAQTQNISVPQNGAYIVKVGKQSVKVTF